MDCPGCGEDISPESVTAFYFDVMKWECLECGILIVKSELSYPQCAIEIKKELALIKRRIDSKRGICKPYNSLKGGGPMPIKK